MPRASEITSPRIQKIAARALRGGTDALLDRMRMFPGAVAKDMMALAGSALTQAPDRKTESDD